MTARTLKRLAATALMLTLVFLTTAGARQQQNPNSAGAGDTSADRPADASKSASKSEAQSAQKSQDEASTNERGPGNTNPARRRKPRRRGHHN